MKASQAVLGQEVIVQQYGIGYIVALPNLNCPALPRESYICEDNYIGVKLRNFSGKLVFAETNVKPYSTTRIATIPNDGELKRIINTDAYGGDYPDEKFVSVPAMSAEYANAIALLLNAAALDSNRWYRVVDRDYELQPGFAP